MENATVQVDKDAKNEDLFQCSSKDIESKEDDSLSKRLVRKAKPEHILILNVRKSQPSKVCIQKSFIQRICGLDNRIPKQIISFDEIYLRRCVQLIHFSALKVASCNIPLKMGTLSDSSTSIKTSRMTCDLARFVTGCPMAAGVENVVVSSTEDWILGTIFGSKSMMNILKSPLFFQLGAMDSDANLERTSLADVREPIGFNFVSSPGGSSISSSQRLQREMVVPRDHRYGSEPVHRRLVSVSSTNSTYSDECSSANAISQGMLQCTWKGGLPHYVFSLDDQREVYIANLFKVESPDDKVLDYKYMFHSSAGGKKESGVCENDSDLVGKMTVSTSFALCPKIMETRFVLFGINDNGVREMQTSSHNLRKNKGLSKKVVDIFRTSHSSRQRTSSKFGTSAIFENSSWEPCQDSCKNPDPLGRTNLLENYLPPNLELAAIIVKDHIGDKHNEAEIGGWGLKFLKKVGIRQTNETPEAPVSSECCLRNTSDCCTSMDILVPAGFHGGPRTRNGGPSSLIERWSSGGHCDCGGWDVGCPLTVLHTKPNKKEASPQPGIPRECKTFDLFTEGKKQGAPIMKMVNIHDGLYYIQFQSTLSALQSFSIAVAIIHTNIPTFRPKCTGVEVA